jgi:hypothetical protein
MTWKEKSSNLYDLEGKKQESLRPGRKKAGIFELGIENPPNL